MRCHSLRLNRSSRQSALRRPRPGRGRYGNVGLQHSLLASARPFLPGRARGNGSGPPASGKEVLGPVEVVRRQVHPPGGPRCAGGGRRQCHGAPRRVTALSTPTRLPPRLPGADTRPETGRKGLKAVLPTYKWQNYKGKAEATRGPQPCGGLLAAFEAPREVSQPPQPWKMRTFYWDTGRPPVPPLTSFSWLPWSLRVKATILSDLVPYSVPPLPLLQPHTLASWKVPGMCLPQGLCLYCALSQGCSSSR